MTEKKIQIQSKNLEGTFDLLFPKTKAAITVMNDGKTVQDVITTILETLNKKVELKTVTEEVKKIVGSAPEALDTLQELAKALNNDASFATTITNLLSKKVEIVKGKQLSTEDFTKELKQKLEKLQINEDGTAKIKQDNKAMLVTKEEKDKWDKKTKIVVSKSEDDLTADIIFKEID